MLDEHQRVRPALQPRGQVGQEQHLLELTHLPEVLPPDPQGGAHRAARAVSAHDEPGPDPAGLTEHGPHPVRGGAQSRERSAEPDHAAQPAHLGHQHRLDMVLRAQRGQRRTRRQRVAQRRISERNDLLRFLGQGPGYGDRRIAIDAAGAHRLSDSP